MGITQYFDMNTLNYPSQTAVLNYWKTGKHSQKYLPQLSDKQVMSQWGKHAKALFFFFLTWAVKSQDWDTLDLMAPTYSGLFTGFPHVCLCYHPPLNLLAAFCYTDLKNKNMWMCISPKTIKYARFRPA